MGGRAWKFGNNVNTDEIIPARYNITIIPSQLAEHVFCEVRSKFSKEAKPGDVIIAGENFGCGSSREHAPIAIKASGIRAIVARSFARIFFRNCINIGLPILQCREAADNVKDGHEIEVDIEKSIIRNITTGSSFVATPLPGFVLKLVETGGLVEFIKNHDIAELA